MESLFLTSRQIYFAVLSFGEVDLLDPEARIYFLQCSSVGEAGFVGLKARVFVSLDVGALM